MAWLGLGIPGFQFNANNFVAFVLVGEISIFFHSSSRGMERDR